MEEKLLRILKELDKDELVQSFYTVTCKLSEALGFGKLQILEKEPYRSTTYSSLVWLNEVYRNSLVSNITLVTFHNLYPRVLVKTMNSNAPQLNVLMDTLLLLRSETLNQELKYHLNFYLNIVFGVTQNKNSKIYADHTRLFSTISGFMGKIREEFTGHIIYIDTDTLHFRNYNEIKDRFVNFIRDNNKYDLTYQTEHLNHGFYVALKRYMFFDKEEIVLKGMAHYHKGGRNRGGKVKIGGSDSTHDSPYLLSGIL